MISQASRNKIPLRAVSSTSMLAINRLKKNHVRPSRRGSLSRYAHPYIAASGDITRSGKKKKADSPSRPIEKLPQGMLQAMDNGAGGRPARVDRTGLSAARHPSHTDSVAMDAASRFLQPANKAASAPTNMMMLPNSKLVIGSSSFSWLKKDSTRWISWLRWRADCPEFLRAFPGVGRPA